MGKTQNDYTVGAPQWDRVDNINRDKVPVRLFKSKALEKFSHISPKLVLATWVPLVTFMLAYGIYGTSRAGGALWHLPIAFVCGWFIWTFMEYIIHRFVFHYHPSMQRIKRAIFTVHGVHHTQPMCKSRLVMPPVISVPLGLLFYGIFYLIGNVGLGQPTWVPIIYAGFMSGYVIYDMVHYALHHAKGKNGFLAMCRRQHMRHHFKCPNMRFAVTMPLWDYVFGTMPSSGLSKKVGKDG